MSKAPSREKTQQDLHKYWNSTTSRSAPKEKGHPISSDNKLNTTNKETGQLISSNRDQTDNLNDKKRKAPVKERTQEETSSPPPKRMHETAENKDEFHRSSSSSNLHTGISNHNHNHNPNPNPNSNINPNPSWIVEMERSLENNLTMNLTQNLRSIIDESVSTAIERVTASVNRIIEANQVIQTHSTAISELQKDSVKTQNSVIKLNKDQEDLRAKLI